MKNLIKILPLVLITSCASSIRINTPSAKFLSPEASGKLLSGSAQLVYNQNQQALLDLSNDSLDNDLKHTNDTSITADAHIGLIEQLDLFVQGGSHSPDLFGVKWQVYGASRRDAKEGDISASIALAYGMQGQSETDQGEDILGTNTDDIEAEVIHRKHEATFILGKRLRDNIVGYANLRHSIEDMEVHLSSSSSTALDGKVARLKSQSTSVGLGLIIYRDSGVYLDLQTSYLVTDFDNSEQTSTLFSGFSIGTAWD